MGPQQLVTTRTFLWEGGFLSREWFPQHPQMLLIGDGAPPEAARWSRREFLWPMKTLWRSNPVSVTKDLQEILHWISLHKKPLLIHQWKTPLHHRKRELLVEQICGTQSTYSTCRKGDQKTKPQTYPINLFWFFIQEINLGEGKLLIKHFHWSAVWRTAELLEDISVSNPVRCLLECC